MAAEEVREGFFVKNIFPIATATGYVLVVLYGLAGHLCKVYMGYELPGGSVFSAQNLIIASVMTFAVLILWFRNKRKSLQFGGDSGNLQSGPEL